MGTFDQNDATLAQTFALHATAAIENTQLFENLQTSNQELSLAYDTTLAGWAKALELRDKETHGHTNRVTDLTMELARFIGLTKTDLIFLRRGVLLHDIGKMGVPDEILHKSGPLTDAEWVEMRKHPQYAFDLLYPILFLRPSIDIPYSHHEWWDGTGYPQKLKGEEIPLPARIFAIVDVWDALLSDRPYRKAWTKTKTAKYLREHAGSHFDPKLVEIFFIMMESQIEKKPIAYRQKGRPKKPTKTSTRKKKA
jgi:HD-GYP domain-containing protein (c-di-GMP phosphodiesterase class II)